MNGSIALLFRILRIAAGLAIAAVAASFLIQGGFSRYAKYGIPAHADWRYLLTGFLMLAIASFLVRPFWWRSLGRH